MFEFAISHNRRRRPSKLIIFAGIASCLIHFSGLVILEKNPQLLRSGVTHHFHTLSFFYRSPKKKIENERIITILRPIDIPSAAVLKKYMNELNNKGKGPSPVVRVPLKDSFKIAINKKAPPLPKLPELKLPEISAPANIPGSSLPATSGGAQNSDFKQFGGSSVQVPSQDGAGKKDSMSLPPPVKLAPIDKTPMATASSTKPPVETTPSLSLPPSLTVSSNKEQALKNSVKSGLFDTEGYPLEKLEKYYKKFTRDIEAKWDMPSNLKKFQGHTIVEFFIDRNGGLYKTHIVSGSGNKNFDISALNAILNSNPVDPLPKDYPGNHLGVIFTFSWNEP
jgi:outer membrane biosynthesis protein TonB